MLAIRGGGREVFQIERVINRKFDAFVQEQGGDEEVLGAHRDRCCIQQRSSSSWKGGVEECERTVQRYLDLEPEALNSDEHLHHLALQEVADLPTAAAAKFPYFCQDQRVNPAIFNLMRWSSGQRCG